MSSAAPTYLVFVYGTLRKTGRYHHLLKNADYLSTVRTHPVYTLVDVGSFPGLLKNGTTTVIGELYKVTHQTLMELDHLEEVPTLYTREEIQLNDGRIAWTYFLHPNNKKKLPIISSGDYFCLSSTIK